MYQFDKISDKSSSSLAMTFPAKGSKSVVQSNPTSTTDDYLDSFFNQSSTKSKAKSSSSSNVKARSVSFLQNLAKLICK